MLALIVALIVTGERAPARTTGTVVLRGRPQLVHLYGTRGGTPIIVSSGDGGWIHLGPHVAEALASRGYFVVGFNTKEYLKSFTSDAGTLHPADVPRDFRTLIDFAGTGAAARPILIGVSEGAGLSVLAAADPATRPLVAGVVALGLPDVNELGWRWKDSLIYVTHGVPNEPTFRTATLVDEVSPIPLAAIHSTGDEFVPATEIQRLMAKANEPKHLWLVKASDHRFSDNVAEFDRCLLESLAWVTKSQPH